MTSPDRQETISFGSSQGKNKTAKFAEFLGSGRKEIKVNDYNDRLSKASSNKNEFSFAEGVANKGKVNSIDMD